ncbi:hypothetical protein E2C01_042289 [Portunus trituberculatus]|uniref:Uncharacterized protein n=1 Tax=Portunus trituberculatus TaxID=210409 RepID=A0A5B7FT83_PORTR|nr:hypothetical protein [Portunus trituberculatus]
MLHRRKARGEAQGRGSVRVNKLFVTHSIQRRTFSRRHNTLRRLLSQQYHVPGKYPSRSARLDVLGCVLPTRSSPAEEHQVREDA